MPAWRCVPFVSICVFVLSVQASLAIMAPQAQAADPPNVVLILIDDLGWTDLACYGSKYYRTPHLDQLAAEGLRFTQAYAACPVCSPTRAALMTGQVSGPAAPDRLHSRRARPRAAPGAAPGVSPGAAAGRTNPGRSVARGRLRHGGDRQVAPRRSRL